MTQPPSESVALVERCPKPGCGAQKIVGRPCYDWDCPQQTLTAKEHASAIEALHARIADLEAKVEMAAEDERDRLYEGAYGQPGLAAAITSSWLKSTGAMLPADRAASRAKDADHG